MYFFFVVLKILDRIEARIKIFVFKKKNLNDATALYVVRNRITTEVATERAQSTEARSRRFVVDRSEPSGFLHLFFFVLLLRSLSLRTSYFQNPRVVRNGPGA